ncbi:MAG: SDR family oxidoreductase, partial [Gemmatimonadetes bacterium]|nr:SDR family oxidoreductase [Gemmatimonadota bacterium]
MTDNATQNETTDRDLAGRRALVTGGGRGIGRAIVAALAAAGAHVAIAARSTEQVNDAVHAITATGATALGLTLDVADATAVTKAIAHVEQQWGGVDILVNNAGVLGPVGRTDQADVDAWLHTVQINLGGCFLCTHACLPGMIERGDGKIINLSGGGASGPRPQFSAYGASKAAIVRFTETLAAELDETGVRVNAIAPGAVNTQMTEMTATAIEAGAESSAAKRQLAEGGADVNRAAQLACFLASSRSDGITGRLFSAIWDNWETVKA